MPKFSCLYLLENFYLYMLEVKRHGLPDNAPGSEKFRWLKIDRETKILSDLTFRSMDSSGEIEERYFEQGFLKFNTTIGTFIEKYNSAQHPLERKNPDQLPTELEELIKDHLTAPKNI